MASKELRKWDKDSGGQITIETEHAHIHRGAGFTCSTSLAIANNAVSDTLIWVPNSVFPHLRVYQLDVDAVPMDITLYEGPLTVVNSGVICTPINLNRVSSRVSSLGVSFIASATLVAGSFTQLEYHRITAAKQEGGSEQIATLEWNLNPGDQYLIRAVNVGAGAAPGGIFIFWYE